LGKPGFDENETMDRKRLYTTLVIIILLMGGSVAPSLQLSQSASAQSIDAVIVPSAALPEAKDFASATFRDAWDMSDYSDISQFLNGGGRNVSLADTSVQNGIFTGRTLRDHAINGLSVFFPLAPGDPTAIQVTKNIGWNHPVPSAQYACLYVAMKTESPRPTQGELPDILIVVWKNSSTNGGGSINLYPEFSVSNPNIIHNWKLYKIPLTSPPNGPFPPGSTLWQNQTYWQSLELTPSIFPDIHFSIDWVRLTSCQDSPQYRANITWTPSSNITAIWARSLETGNNIQLVSGINGSSGSYSLDTKGMAPGSYTIGVGGQTSCCSQWSTNPLVINKAPLATFTEPSPISGEDYAASGGNAWDIRADDLDSIQCLSSYGFIDHLMTIDTPAPRYVSGQCKGATGDVDGKLYLNMPATLQNAGDYRYFSFSHYINGAYALPADGMMARLMWRTTDGCIFVSNDIGYDVGRHDYMIDLWDAHHGSPEVSVPPSCGLRHWRQAGRITYLRFDPNENYTGYVVPEMTFHQEYDWFRLTKEDRVQRGQIYQIAMSVNKPVDEIPSIQFFYTTDRNNPTQHVAQRFTPSPPPPQMGDLFIFLPIIPARFDFQREGATFQWDTAGVSPGTYYTCAILNDGINEFTICSDVTITVFS
jgi:hypothetical protein